MPRMPVMFEIKPAFEPQAKATAQDIYTRCRRNGYFFESELASVEDWPRLVAALRRLAKAEDLSVSTHTERQRSFPHRPTRQVQVHKNGTLAYLS